MKITSNPIKAASAMFAAFSLSMTGWAADPLTIAQSAALSLSPQQWPDCDCDNIATVLSWDFENVPVSPLGSSYPSIAPSFIYPGIVSSTISGPGGIKVTAPGGLGTNQWGCFGGFPSNGDPGTIGFEFKYNSDDFMSICGLSFDVFSEGISGETNPHGPTGFRVKISSNGDLVWVSEDKNLTPGINNAINWNIANPDGDDSNGDGTLFASNFDWLTLTNGDKLSFEIEAWGATTSLVGLDLDNIQVMACVPEPSGALVLMVAGLVAVVRRRGRSALL